MRNKMRFLPVLLLLAQSIVTKAQSFDSTLVQYNTQIKQERVYFHFDKSSYFPGDTIWYKAYLAEGWSLSDVSKTLYTDWIDANGTLVLHGVEPIVFSTSYGQIVVPKNYKGSTFHLHAYTPWMLNFDASLLFDKDIPVIQPKGPSAAKLPAYKVKVSLMPEGGNLVQSLNSAIAFKAENQSGRPIFITGAIKNRGGEVIDSIYTDHDGMGKFFLTPEAGEAYSVAWKNTDGDSGSTTLTSPLAAGAVLKASVASGKVGFHIERTADAPSNFKKMYLIGMMNQVEAFRFSIDLEKISAATNKVPTDQLASGILQLTLFDANWKPVAERIVFVNNGDYSFTSKLNATKKGLNKRGRNEVEIEVPDSAASNLSVSVTDASLGYDNSYDIVSYLLLSSQLKGYISNPSYYFSNNSDSVTNALDLVMLTNGWRRYNWDELLAGKLPALKHPRETAYASIDGLAMMKDSSVVSEGSKIVLSLHSTNPADSLQITNLVDLHDDGSFNFKPGAFYDTLQINYKLLGNKKTTNKGIVHFTSSFLAPLPSYSNIPVVLTAQQDSLALATAIKLKADADELAKMLGQVTLKNVTVTAKTKTTLQIMDEQYSSPAYQTSHTGNTYSFDVIHDPDAKGLYSLSTYLIEKVPGLQQQIGGVPPSASYYFRPHAKLNGGITGKVQIYLDELATDDATASTIQLSDVAMVKFYKPGALIIARDEPALAIYTRRGSDASAGSDAALKQVNIAGFTPVKEFYSPDYAAEPDAQGADVRTTLYWNPNIRIAHNQHKVKFIFYNNDISKKLRVVLEGMNADGKVTRAEKVIE